MMRACLTVTVLWVAAGLAEPARAQVLDLGLGAGYVVGGGSENPGPSLPTFDVVSVIWPWSSWGLAFRWVEGPGEDLYDQPIASGDRTFLGFGHLRYFTVTARHRRRFSDTLGLELGAGMALQGQFATIQELPAPIGRLDDADILFGGFATEALVTRRLLGRLWLQAGATFDFNFETNNFQPVLFAVYRF